jgi:hypothetical protein
MTTAYDKHIEKALASIGGPERPASSRQRRRSSHRTDYVISVSSSATQSASARGKSWVSPRSHVEAAITRVDDRTAEIIENAEAPLWPIVREAVEAREA